MKKWLVKSIDKTVSEALSKSTALPSLICDMLTSRGITSVELANEFFKGETISDPFLIKDMDNAVSAIEEAIENGDKITVYGDYDCDGITAAVMLYQHLEAIGADAAYYIPTRDEGYGLNKEAVKKICEDGTKLIITVDNGISAAEEADYIYELSMKLVVTDHHNVPDRLPKAEAVVDPHRSDDSSGCIDLAGCSVALKLIMALENDTVGVLEQYSDLACIGTVADVVPLVGENRIIVRTGLQLMECSENIGLVSLADAAGIELGGITSQEVAFGLSPRINAAGRYGDPSIAAEMLLTDDINKAREYAARLCEFNEKRKILESEMLKQAQDILENDKRLFDAPVLIVSADGWQHGIVGIVAAKLLELYGKPVIVIAQEGDISRGSARSIEGFSIYKALQSAEDVLIRFGGHNLAAGITLRTEDIPKFRSRILEYVFAAYSSMPVYTIYADKLAESGDLSLSQIEKLDYLRPFGEQNPQPLLCIENCVITSLRPIGGGRYTSFIASSNNETYKFLCFSIPYNGFPYAVGDRVDMLAVPEVNEYNGEKSVVCRVREIRFSGTDQDKYFAAKKFYDKILLGQKIDPRLKTRIIPSKNEMKIIYDLCRQSARIEAAAEKAGRSGINYCMFMITLHIFAEFGHLKINKVRDEMQFLKGGRFIELSSSSVVKAVEKCCEADI